MTTTFFLVRHAAHDNVGGFLAGRTPGVRLGHAGRAQAGRLADRMRRERFAAIHASPRERSQETAAAIAIACGIDPVAENDQLDEIDFGGWSGKTFAELEDYADWRLWNSDRLSAATPAGETMTDVEARVVSCMTKLMARHPEQGVVLVSHADVVKAAVCHILVLPADAGRRFDISPASITTVVAGDWGARLLTLNETIH
jgi:broad specificity phosphatase PhoE